MNALGALGKDADGNGMSLAERADALKAAAEEHKLDKHVKAARTGIIAAAMKSNQLLRMKVFLM